MDPRLGFAEQRLAAVIMAPLGHAAFLCIIVDVRAFDMLYSSV